ncbi:hypothetical protein F2Q70_00000455 [Brassica cretica]|uniref:Transcription factor CBF/NF-Y/archaeal histone domain-containing protein n=1 Tax=Brassica cretica TaxID=69181 RepID=A0A8S9IW82_BRACR|nr:hypothetical protein F2Q70_00000455 [Brassica cretica]
MDPMDIVGKSKEDASLPKATMTKIIKEMLPPDVRVARDAQDLLIECCVGIKIYALLLVTIYLEEKMQKSGIAGMMKTALDPTVRL